MWTAAILVGGQARRLGSLDKSALEVGGRSILERQLALARSLTPHLLIVARDGQLPRAYGVPVALDRVPGAGALGGLYTALLEAPTEQVVVIACDMPFLTAPFLTRLAEVGAEAEVAMPHDARGSHPLCASYHRRIATRLRGRIDAGHLGVLDALTGLDVRRIGSDELAPFDPTGRLLLNVNTPEDYARARAAAEATQPPA